MTAAAPTVAVPTASAALTPEQIAKLQSELDIVSMNMSILGEMLTALKPGQEDPADYKLLTELCQTCKYGPRAYSLHSFFFVFKRFLILYVSIFFFYRQRNATANRRIDWSCES